MIKKSLPKKKIYETFTRTDVSDESGAEMKHQIRERNEINDSAAGEFQKRIVKVISSAGNMRFSVCETDGRLLRILDRKDKLK